ncbi:MAG: hypothetical protein WD358_06985 [Nitriliruptoraceae bacterium]
MVLLAAAGVALLIAAAAVFTAMTWTRLPLVAQAAILFAVTAGAVVAGIAMHRRSLPVVAAAVGVLASLLAAVDVIAVQRSGLYDFGAYVVPVAGVAVAVVAWILVRFALRGANWTGAIATLAVAVSATIAVTIDGGLGLAGFGLAGAASVVVSMAAAWAWRRGATRSLVIMGALAWMTLIGLANAVGIIAANVEIGDGAIVALIAVLVLGIAAGPWMESGWVYHRVAVAPGVLVATASVGAIVAASVPVDGSVRWLGSGPAITVAATGVLVAVVVHVADRMTGQIRWALVAGSAPAAVGVALFAAGFVFRGAIELAATPAGLVVPRSDPWGLAAVAAGAVALMALRRVRRHPHLVAASVVVASLAVADQSMGWIVMTAFALVSIGLAHWLHVSRAVGIVTSLGAVVVGIVLATPDSATLLMASLAGVLVGWGSVRGREATRIPVVVRRAGLVVALLAVGTAAAGAAALIPAWSTERAVQICAALVASHTAAWLAADRCRRRGETVGAALAIVASAGTIAVIAGVSQPTPFGLLMIASGAGWLALSEFNLKAGEWIGTILVALGLLVVVAGGRVDALEAFTVPLGVVVAVIFARRIIHQPNRSSAQLWPAMVIALVPSLVLLVGDPAALWRALGLAIGAGALVAGGLKVGWRSPVIAGSVTAIVVALTQIGVVWEVVPRWITFAAVGVMLVRLAATYERQRQRAATARRRLADLR